MSCNHLRAAPGRAAPLSAALLLLACSESPVQESADALAAPASVAAAAASDAGSSRRNREAIEQIVATFDAAWNAGDAATYAGQYAAAEIVPPNGAVLSDPAAILALYEALFSFVFPGTTRVSQIRDLTFLTGTIAVLEIDLELTGYASLPPGVVEYAPGVIRTLEKNLLVKRGGQWTIVRHQATAKAPGT
jgi:uncharacterized protein (TIGR02246 family)